MFDSLKKRLKEAVEKVSRAVRDDKDDYAQLPAHAAERDKQPEITFESVEEQETERIIEKEELEKYGKTKDETREGAEDTGDAEGDVLEEGQEDVQKAIDEELDKRHEEREIKEYEKKIGDELQGAMERLHEGHFDKKEDHVRPVPQAEETKSEENQAGAAVARIDEKDAGKKEKEPIEEQKQTFQGIRQLLGKKPMQNAEELKPELKTETEPKPETTAEKEQGKGVFSRIFEKTLTEGDIRGILRELEMALLENDVAVEVAERIGEDVKNDLLNRNVRRGRVEEMIRESLRRAMLNVMSRPKMDLGAMIGGKPGVFTIMFLGFNGVGKTTCVAKFAMKFKKFNPIVAAGDTFRAASIEQLEEHARRVGFRLIKHQYGSDAAAVIFDAKKAALASGSRLVLADTAGRSHSNVNLMDELKKLVRVNQPDLKILVLDAITGNDIYDQARMFDDAVGVDAIILTKADVYDKGGAALSATYTLKKPILFLGVGQEYGDLKEFNPEEIADQILG